MPLKRDYADRPLIGALVLSILLHAFALFADRIEWRMRDPENRIIIQASLQTAPIKVIVPPEPAPSQTRTQPAKPAAPGSTAVPGRRPESNSSKSSEPSEPGKPAEPEPERPPREALVLSDPGAPEYPDDAVRRKLESCVLAAVLVSAGGEVESVRILHADVAAVFDRAVIDAYSRARYLPAQANGENVPSRVLAVASFVLTPQRTRHCAGRYAPAARKINAMPVSARIDPALVETLLNAGR